MRKPIQICVTAIAEHGSAGRVITLCDDGSLWAIEPGGSWDRLPGIPQDEPVASGETPEAEPSIEEDADLFRYWLGQTWAFPGRLANAFTGCERESDYRRALRKMMQEDKE